MKTKNKHGRVGVKKTYHPARPLSQNQKDEIAAQYFKSGWDAGRKDALGECSRLVNGARTIRDARRRIEDLNGQA